MYHLTTVSETVAIEHLATEISKWEGDYTTTHLSETSRSVKIDLHHAHLPKLADAGVITFGSNAEHIELGDADGVGQFLTDAARIDGCSHTAADD